MATETYTLEQAESDIGTLTGQVGILEEAHTFTDSTDPPDSPAAGIIGYSLAGDQKYASSDGGYYNTGMAHLWTTGTQLINAAADALITGLSAPVAAGTYRLAGVVTYQSNTAAGTPAFSFHLPATSLIAVPSMYVVQGAGGTQPVPDFNTSGGIAGAPGNASHMVCVYVSGIVTFTAAGTLSLQANAGGTVNTITIQAGSFLDLMPAS